MDNIKDKIQIKEYKALIARLGACIVVAIISGAVGIVGVLACIANDANIPMIFPILLMVTITALVYALTTIVEMIKQYIKLSETAQQITDTIKNQARKRKDVTNDN